MGHRKLTRNPIPSNLRAAAKHLRDKAEPAPDHMVPNDESAAEFDAAAAGIDTSLISELSDRGFSHFPKVLGLYGGTARVYESSLATTEAIWLRTEDVPTGNSSKPTSETTLHLSMPNALALAAQIIELAHASGWWLDTDEVATEDSDGVECGACADTVPKASAVAAGWKVVMDTHYNADTEEIALVHEWQCASCAPGAHSENAPGNKTPGGIDPLGHAQEKE